MTQTIDILAGRRVISTYRTDIRFAVEKDFFYAFGNFNPPYQVLANGYRLHLRSGDRVDVPCSFQVEVLEADRHLD